MDFYLNDFTDEACERIKDNWTFYETGSIPEDEPIASMRWTRENKLPKISGEWEQMSQLIPILKDMGYDELRLAYEDCGIWTLTAHQTEYDEFGFHLV